MKIDIDEVEKSEYTLEDVLVLLELEYARGGKKFPYNSTNKEQYLDLVKRGVLTVSPNGYTISTHGFQELRSIIGATPLKLKHATKAGNFDEFYETYPVSDAHGIWRRTRGIRSDRPGTKISYDRILKEKGVTHEKIMSALKWDIKDKKVRSTTSNRLSFMKGSKVWLNQREFDTIDAVRGHAEQIEEDGTDNWTENSV